MMYNIQGDSAVKTFKEENNVMPVHYSMWMGCDVLFEKRSFQFCIIWS